MKFKKEDLVKIVAGLTDEYTSKESTSISYETANQLMGAVIYCMKEINQSENASSLIPKEHASAREVYNLGYDLVMQRIKDAMEIYHEILPIFDDYGSQCLKETIQEGIPEFFKWYDPKFNPQNTILTLDYPTNLDLSLYSGIDAIYLYLKSIRAEQQILRTYDRAELIDKLNQYNPDYPELIENLLDMI